MPLIATTLLMVVVSAAIFIVLRRPGLMKRIPWRTMFFVGWLFYAAYSAAQIAVPELRGETPAFIPVLLLILSLVMLFVGTRLPWPAREGD